MARILITSAIPYINGIKHLGNLVGSQLPADLYARYQRGRGNEVMFLCATDEHGTPAELAAAKAGKPVAEYCAEMQIQASSRSFMADWHRYRCLVSRTSRSVEPDTAERGSIRSVGSSCLVQFSHWSPRALS